MWKSVLAPLISMEASWTADDLFHIFTFYFHISRQFILWMIDMRFSFFCSLLSVNVLYYEEKTQSYITESIKSGLVFMWSSMQCLNGTWIVQIEWRVQSFTTLVSINSYSFKVSSNSLFFSMMKYNTTCFIIIFSLVYYSLTLPKKQHNQTVNIIKVHCCQLLTWAA